MTNHTPKTEQRIAGFTPGPWYAEGDDVLKNDGRGQTGKLATCFWGDWEIAKANARLMAAGPELLEACRNTLTALMLANLDGSGKLRNELQLAIAKAEGRSL